MQSIQKLRELRLKEYTDFLEERVGSLEQEVQDLQEILTMIFESDDEEEDVKANVSIRFCTCDLDEDDIDDEEDDEEEDEDESDW